MWCVFYMHREVWFFVFKGSLFCVFFIGVGIDRADDWITLGRSSWLCLLRILPWNTLSGDFNLLQARLSNNKRSALKKSIFFPVCFFVTSANEWFFISAMTFEGPSNSLYKSSQTPWCCLPSALVCIFFCFGTVYLRVAVSHFSKIVIFQ